MDTSSKAKNEEIKRQNSNPILLVKDNHLDAMTAERTLKDLRVTNQVTTSSKQQDIAESFKLGVAGYIVKPIDYKKLVDAIRRIEPRWTLSGLPD
jgi:response regulator of citrate/malate metabolism